MIEQVSIPFKILIFGIYYVSKMTSEQMNQIWNGIKSPGNYTPVWNSIDLASTLPNQEKEQVLQQLFDGFYDHNQKVQEAILYASKFISFAIDDEIWSALPYWHQILLSGTIGDDLRSFLLEQLDSNTDSRSLPVLFELLQSSMETHIHFETIDVISSIKHLETVSVLEQFARDCAIPALAEHAVKATTRVQKFLETN